ncbi:MAG: hypothetical protein ACRCT1_12020 [Microcoleaceae cyanobacterium]|jgi:hypothetical protein
MNTNYFKTITIILVTILGVILSQVREVESQNQAQILVRNENSLDANLVKFKQVEYVGQCPGTVITGNIPKGRFQSSTTSPNSNRRVIIKNVTLGMENNPYPYTDRNYDTGEFSERFDFGLDSRHRTKSLSVVEGENQFKYTIQQKENENENIVEEGELMVKVEIQNLGVFPRSAICEEKVTCEEGNKNYHKNSQHNWQGKSCYTTTRCHCP